MCLKQSQQWAALLVEQGAVVLRPCGSVNWVPPSPAQVGAEESLTAGPFAPLLVAGHRPQGKAERRGERLAAVQEDGFVSVLQLPDARAEPGPQPGPLGAGGEAGLSTTQKEGMQGGLGQGCDLRPVSSGGRSSSVEGQMDQGWEQLQHGNAAVFPPETLPTLAK